MTKDDFDFDTWFGVLQTNVLDRVNVELQDSDAFRQDYADGSDVYDVIDGVCLDYDFPDSGYDDTDADD